jgi:hypothetical protein
MLSVRLCRGDVCKTADKQGKVTDVTIWRAGFLEEREVLVGAKMPL